MRSTLQLQGERRAVVDIPLSKLGTGKGEEHQCCDSKVIVSGTGSRSSYNLELKRMVEEMEEAYDRDMKDYQGRIGKLEVEKSALSEQYSRERNELSNDFNSRRISYEKEIDALRQDCRRKDGEIRKLFEEKEVIIRNKISEFKQTEYINRINEQDQIIRLKDLQIKELINKIEASHLNNLKGQNQNQGIQRRLESQISRLTQQLSETTIKLTSEQSSINYISKIKQEEGDRLLQELRYQLELASRSLREEEHSNQVKNKQIATLNDKLTIQQTKIYHLQDQLAIHKKEISQLNIVKVTLSDKLFLSNENVSLKEKEIQQLLASIGELQAQLLKLRKELEGKQRVYEVKIERVIDGKEQIDQLQAVIFQLEQQLKQLNQEKDFLAQDLKKSQQQVQGLKSLKLKLQVQISELRAYIAKKESSFRWMVEREIEKDISVSDVKPQLYKVSQVSQYSREGQGEATRLISQQIAINLQANLFNSYPQQIILEGNR